MCLLVFIFGLGFGAKASAATYYVDASIGSNANTTTQAQNPSTPWLTIQYANDTATTGDTIHVAAGTYTGAYSGTYGFNFTKNIIWIADGTVILNTDAPATVAIIRAGAGISFTGFTWQAENKRLIYYDMASGTATFASNIFSINHLVGYTTSAITVNGSGTLNFQGNTFTAANLRSSFLGFGNVASSGSVTISGSIVNITNIYDGSNTFYIAGGIWQVDINNNNFTYSNTPGSTYQASAIYVSNQLNPSISGNEIVSHSSVPSTEGFTHIYLLSTGVNLGSPEIRNNTMSTNSENSYLVRMGGEASAPGDEKMTVQFTGNKLYGPIYADLTRMADTTIAIHLVLYGYQKNGYFYGNKFFGGGYGLVLKGTSTWTAGGVYYNEFYNNRLGVHIKGPENIPLYNNSIVINHDYSTICYGFSIISWGGNDPVNIILKNNLLYFNSSYAGHIPIRQDGDVTDGFASDYNLIYKTATTDNYGSLSAILKTKDEWQALGYDAHSVFLNPSLVSSSNFHLQNTSPAINAGTNSVWSGQNNITDYEGNPITNGSGAITASGGTVDIGAYEFQDSTAPTTTADIVSSTYNTHQAVTLTCSDGAGVGCDKTYYTLTGVDPTTSSIVYTTAISIPDNATTILKFFSIDRSNNTETPIKSKTYIIDTIAPETTIDSNPNASINTNSATFTFSANETSTFQCKLDSGVYATCTTPKNYTSLSEGSHTFYVKATDTATSEDTTPASYTFIVDTLVPTIYDLSPNNTTLSATTTSTNLTLTTSEITTCKYSATSGTDYASMTTFDTTNNTTHSTLITNLNSGTTYGYYIKCQDPAGNLSSEASVTFSIAPEENKISLSAVKIKINRQFNKFKDTIQLTKNKFKLKSQDDNLANGTVKIYKGNSLWKTVSIDANGAWSKTLKLANDTTKTIKLKFYDALGTLLGTKKAKIKVDTEDPKFNEAIPGKMTIGRNQKISFPATDDNSGIDYYKVKLTDVRDWRQQNEDFYQIPEDVPNGTYDLFIRAYDKTGNYAEEKTTLNVSQYRNSVSLASASLNPYNTSERNTQNNQSQIQNQTDKNTDTTPNNYSSSNSPSPQTQSQASSPAGGVHWWNPFSWF